MDVFEENDISLAILTETWFRSGRELDNELLDLQSAENISLITKNRCSRGSGVAVAYRSNQINMKEFKLHNNNFEIVCAVGSSGTTKRKIAVLSIYIPPRQKVATTAKLKECVSDGISKLKTIFDNPLIIIGGDTNNRRLAAILEDHADLAVVQAPATRLGAKLDETVCNFLQNVKQCSVAAPLETESGTRSDHGIVLVKAELDNHHHFSKRSFIYRPITEAGKEKIVRAVALQDWAGVCRGDASESAEALRVCLDELIADCFPAVTVRIKSSDHPWITKAVKKQIRRRKRVFAREGRSEKWKKLKKETEELIKKKKAEYFEKIKQKTLNARNAKAYYIAVKMLNCKEVPEVWNVRVLFPGKTDGEIATILADYFNRIS